MKIKICSAALCALLLCGSAMSVSAADVPEKAVQQNASTSQTTEGEAEHQHSYRKVVVSEPSCTKEGEYVYICDECGDTYTENIAKLPHTVSDWIIDKPAAEGVAGKRHKECKVCHTVLKQEDIPALAINISKATVTYTSSYVYSGKEIKPAVIVKLNGKALVKNTDYTVTYSSNKDVGTGKLVIKGKGKYTGTITKTFTIKAPTVNAPTNFRNVNSTSSAIRMEWNKASGVTGYKIQNIDPYYNDWDLTGKRDASKNAICKVSCFSGVTYKFRICSYKEVGGKVFYSDWVYAYGTACPDRIWRVFEKNASTSGYTLSWNGVRGASKYIIYRYDYSKKSYYRYKTIDAADGGSYSDEHTFKFTDCKPGQKDKFKIVAAEITSAKTYYSKPIEGEYAASPAKVQNVKKVKVDRNKLRLNWDKVSGADCYQVFYSSSKNSGYKKLKEVNGTMALITNLPAGKSYYIKVRAVVRAGNASLPGACSTPITARVFNDKTYASIINSYSNAGWLTTVNAQGYKMSSYANSRLTNSLTCLGGTASFLLLDMDSGAMVGYNAKSYLGTASTVKMPYMLYCLKQMENGSPSMDTLLTYNSSDYSSGSGTIKNYSFGTKFTIRDCMQYIFDYSDNCAYYMLQDRFGIDGYNKFIASLGCRTTMNSWNRWGYVSAADSAKEWLQMYYYLYHGRYANFVRKGFANSTASNFRLGLNYKYTVYSKCGWTDDLHHDTAVVEAEHPYVLICFTDRVSSSRLQEVARAADYVHDEMWRYYNNN